MHDKKHVGPINGLTHEQLLDLGRKLYDQIQENTMTKRIDNLDRLKNSPNGNPRYRVTFTDGSTAVTQSDASFCYEITNSELRGEVVVRYSRDGKITDMSPAPKSED